MALTPERRAALTAARASVLVHDHFGVDIPGVEWSAFGASGAATALDGRAWVAVADGEPVGLGAAMAWAWRNGADQIDLLVSPTEGAGSLGVLARRASTFARPPTVWSLVDGGLSEVAADPPDPILVAPPIVAEFVLLLEQSGVDVVVEDGVVIGELRGLEVARVIVDETGSDDQQPAARIEVGVGRFDREAFALIHGELSPPQALAQVVADVGATRRPGAEPHPINRLARERWLRHQLIEDPSLVGAENLVAGDSAKVRGGLRETAIAVAVGERLDGRPLVVATSTGVDLEAVVDAADARLRHNAAADLVLVVPPRDDHVVTRHLAGLLTNPAEVIPVEGEWPSG